jgi:hypothetical protein
MSSPPVSSKRGRKGGNYLSEGRYGCVYEPPLKCKPKTKKIIGHHSGKAVGKLTSLEEAKQTLDASMILKRLENADDYFILVDSICEAEEGREKQECEPVKNKARVSQIVMPYGGLTLDEIKDNHANHLINNFMFYIGHILESGAYLLISNLVHFDLHRKNVVVQNKPRIIDLGFIWSPINLTKNNVEGQLRSYNPRIDQESPEASYINGSLPPYDIKDELLVSDIFTRKPSCQILQQICGITIEQQQTIFRKFLSNSQAIQKSDNVAFFKTYWSKFDSWGFGTILARLTYEYMFNTLFANTVYKPNKTVFDTVIKGLLNPDPGLRLDAIEALQIWNPKSTVLANKQVDAWLTSQSSIRSSSSA